jgi:hypothetical protein
MLCKHKLLSKISEGLEKMAAEVKEEAKQNCLNYLAFKSALYEFWAHGSCSLTSSFFFFGLLSSPLSSESESALRLPPSDLSVSCAVFCDWRNSAMRSGQSRFSSGSHVLSSLKPEGAASHVRVSIHTQGHIQHMKTASVLGKVNNE